jgi:hypothetical protein
MYLRENGEQERNRQGNKYETRWKNSMDAPGNQCVARWMNAKTLSRELSEQLIVVNKGNGVAGLAKELAAGAASRIQHRAFAQSLAARDLAITTGTLRGYFDARRRNGGRSISGLCRTVGRDTGPPAAATAAIHRCSVSGGVKTSGIRSPGAPSALAEWNGSDRTGESPVGTGTAIATARSRWNPARQWRRAIGSPPTSSTHHGLSHRSKIA